MQITVLNLDEKLSLKKTMVMISDKSAHQDFWVAVHQIIL